MYEKLPSPEMLHAMSHAEAMESSAVDVTKYPLYQNIVEAINSGESRKPNTPITLFGVQTREYIIMPCSSIDQDPSVLAVIQHLRGEGWYADVYRISRSMAVPTEYRHCIIVCWEPKILKQSYLPRYYSGKDVRIPCSNCSKHKTGEATQCEGCATLRLWIPGTLNFKGYGDPCLRCIKSLSKKGVAPSCDGCPAKRLWQEMVDDGIISPEIDLSIRRRPAILKDSYAKKGTEGEPEGETNVTEVAE